MKFKLLLLSLVLVTGCGKAAEWAAFEQRQEQRWQEEQLARAELALELENTREDAQLTKEEQDEVIANLKLQHAEEIARSRKESKADFDETINSIKADLQDQDKVIKDVANTAGGILGFGPIGDILTALGVLEGGRAINDKKKLTVVSEAA